MKKLHKYSSVDEIQVGDYLFFDHPDLEDSEYRPSILSYVGKCVDIYGDKKPFGCTFIDFGFAFKESKAVYRASPFMVLLKMMKLYTSYNDVWILPESSDVPKWSNSDEILLGIFAEYWATKEIVDTFDFSNKEESYGFHKAFRQCDVLDREGYDSIVWNALRDAPLFWYLFNKHFELE